MNILSDLKEKFFNQQLSKSDYIEQIGKKHNILYCYSDFLTGTIAKKIEISKESVLIELESGIKLTCIKDDYRIIPIEILNFNKYEEPLWDAFLSILDKKGICFDIGANIGYFSLYMSHKLPNTEFYSFEPIEKTFDYLNKNLVINDAKNIHSYNIGLSNKKEELEMFYNPHLSGNSSMKNLSEKDYVQKIACKFSTLDDFMEENNIENIDFIKCDVEGAEKFVFEGGMNTLKRFKPIIFTEMLRKWAQKFNYHPNDIIELLATIGYKCYAINNKDCYLIKEVTDSTQETNFVFK